MRGLLRLGLVLSVLWFVGFGGWVWISSVGGRDELYALQLQRCYRSSSMKREELQGGDVHYREKIANISREYYTCTERVRAAFDSQMDELRSHIWRILAVDAGSLAAIWSLVWLGVVLGRRVAAGLRQQA